MAVSLRTDQKPANWGFRGAQYIPSASMSQVGMGAVNGPKSNGRMKLKRLLVMRSTAPPPMASQFADLQQQWPPKCAGRVGALVALALAQMFAHPPHETARPENVRRNIT